MSLREALLLPLGEEEADCEDEASSDKVLFPGESVGSREASADAVPTGACAVAEGAMGDSEDEGVDEAEAEGQGEGGDDAVG